MFISSDCDTCWRTVELQPRAGTHPLIKSASKKGPRLPQKVGGGGGVLLPGQGGASFTRVCSKPHLRTGGSLHSPLPVRESAAGEGRMWETRSLSGPQPQGLIQESREEGSHSRTVDPVPMRLHPLPGHQDRLAAQPSPGSSV